MHSHWQLEVEQGFAKAICATGEVKKPASWVLAMSEMCLIDSCSYMTMTFMWKKDKKKDILA